MNWLKTQGPKAALELLANVLAPLAIYGLVHARLGDVWSLVAAGAPPLLWSIGGFAMSRRIDALSLIVLAGIALSVLALVGGGGAKFLQLREHLVLAAIGLAFLGSAAIGRPLIYQLARARLSRTAGNADGWFEALREAPQFRRAMLVMTLAWGVALVLEASACGVLVFVLTVPQYLIVSPILGYGSLGVLTAWTYWYARRRIGPLRAALTRPRSIG
jgi:hypothetical protein